MQRTESFVEQIHSDIDHTIRQLEEPSGQEYAEALACMKACVGTDFSKSAYRAYDTFLKKGIVLDKRLRALEQLKNMADISGVSVTVV